jgi:hypothetical protein
VQYGRREVPGQFRHEGPKHLRDNMKVKELIKILKQYEPETNVYQVDACGGYYEDLYDFSIVKEAELFDGETLEGCIILTE